MARWLYFLLFYPLIANAWLGWEYDDDVNAPVIDEPVFTERGRYEALLNKLSLAFPGFRHRDFSPRFNNIGFRTNDLLGQVQSSSRAMKYVFPDRFVQAGWYDDGASIGGFVSRHWLDGSYDTSFSSDGIALLNFGGNETIFHAIDTDSQGRYVVAGKRGATGSGDYSFFVARFDTAGNADTAFNTVGFVTLGIDSSQTARAVGIDSLDRPVVGGYVETGLFQNSDLMIARLNTNGSLDTDFGTLGITTTEIDVYGFEAIYALKVMGDNRVAVAGGVKNTLDTGDMADFMAAIYQTDGTLDPSFSTDGVLTFDHSDHDNAWALTVDASNRLILVGRSLSGARFFPRIARVGTGGTLEFSNLMAMGNRSIFRGIDIDDGGSYVVTGRYRPNATGDWDTLIARVLTTGGLDNTFSANGWDIADVGAGQDDIGMGVYAQNEKIIVAGRVDLDTGLSTNFGWGLVRWNSDGVEVGGAETDDWFNVDGIGSVDFFADTDRGVGMVRESTGKYLVGGWVENGGAATRDFGAARFLSNGDLDTTYGTSGTSTADFFGDRDEAYDVAMDGNNRLYVAGFSENGGNATRDYAIARFDTDGSLDASWGAGGLVNLDFAGTQDFGRAVAYRSDGFLYVGGFVQSGNGQTQDFGIARLDSSGAQDTSWGTAGWAIADFTGTRDQLWGMKMTSDNKIYAMGYTEVGGGGATTRDIAIARFDSTGALDAGWNGSGLVAMDIATGEEQRAYEAVVNPDGSVFIAGFINRSADDDFFIARFNSNGSLSTNFGDSGGYAVYFSSNGRNENLLHLTENNHGQLVAAGSAGGGMIARINSDGSLDTYGAFGYGTIDEAGNDFPYDILYEPDGKLMVGGTKANDFGIMRVFP